MRPVSPLASSPPLSRNKQSAAPRSAKRAIHDGLPLDSREVTFLRSLDCVVSFQNFFLHSSSPPVCVPPLRDPVPKSPTKRSRASSVIDVNRPRGCSMRIADLLNTQSEAPCRAQVTQERWKSPATNEKPLRSVLRRQLMPQERVFAIQEGEKRWIWMPIAVPDLDDNFDS